MITDYAQVDSGLQPSISYSSTKLLFNEIQLYILKTKLAD